MDEIAKGDGSLNRRQTLTATDKTCYARVQQAVGFTDRSNDRIIFLVQLCLPLKQKKLGVKK